jgi:hypothetical protein
MKKKNIMNKKCKHNWKPFGEDAVTSFTTATPSYLIKFIYHWYCTKCNKTKETTDGWKPFDD